ncbi:MAG: DUF87 domain-containing protein [Candidatus Nanoperiomorbaceae bacterium]
MSKKKTSPELIAQQQAQEDAEVAAALQKGITTLRDLIAPASIKFENRQFTVGTRFCRTLYAYGYPRVIYTGWLSSIINLDEVIDLSIYIYPVDSGVVMNNLKKKVTQLEASMSVNEEHGMVRDPAMEAAYQDAEELRDELQLGSDKFFRFGLYFTISGENQDELDNATHKMENILGQQMVLTKVASSQQEAGLNSTMPQFTDQLSIRHNMDTGAVSTSFPFTSADLTQDNGILYGVNMHNNGLVIFDRFSLENANLCVFAKAGAGKSFTVKLEALRSMMMGTDIIVIDPENEYEKLSEAVGGSYVHLSLNSNTRVNPFDLPQVTDSDDGEETDALRANLVTLHGLFRQMLGQGQVSADGTTVNVLSAREEADLDQALIDTYARAGITSDPLTHNSRPPVMANLYDTMVHMGGSGPDLAQRLRQYTVGTFAGIFSEQSNVDINNHMVVFNIRDLEDELRPIAMYIVLSHIWNKIRAEKRKRMLIVDEAWQLMKYPDSANFMFSIAKRCRKYYLGLTTITQDVEDFMGSQMGRAIVANSSMQILLKQSPTAVDVLGQVFKLTEEELRRLSNFPVGQGLFFAGPNHVLLQVIASETETGLITTNPAATS